MEEVEFCCTSGKRKSSLSDGKLRLEQKSRAARRRRMEIRRLKIVAMASSGCGRAVDLSRKRSTLGDLEGVCERGSVEVCEALSGVEEVVREVCEEEEYCCLSLEEEVRNERVERDAFGDVLDSKCCFGFVSICGKRKEMEDAVCVQPEFCCKKRGRRGNRMRFFGIFDGHGGSEAANFCKDRLHQVLAEELELPALVSSERQWRKAFTRCFSRVDGEVLSGRFTCGNNCESASDCFCTHTIASEAVGTTAVVAVIDPKQIVVANCGDSRVVLSRAGRAIALSQDHKPDRADEMARIEAAGGHVIFWDGPRVSGVLAMSRAIGDKYLKPYVISEPDVTVTERNNDDECLILASDGLWDVLSNEVVCEVARRCLSGKKLQSASAMGSPSDVLNGTGNGMSRSSTAAALLTQLALAKGSQDNISVVVVDLKQRLDTLSQS